MKKIFFAAGLFMAIASDAQLVNNGATIVIQNGGSIFCAGNFTNTSGTITNDGKIEVQGNFANSGTYNSTGSEDSLIMSGAGNATLNSGGATFRYLTINKAANSDLVTLSGTIIVGNKLDYLTGILSTDYLSNPSFSVTAPTSAVFNFGAGREIIGNVKRTGWTNGAASVFNSAHMQMTTNGGTNPSELMVTMLPQAYGGDPTQAEREVKRKFLFTPTGGSGFTADVRFPYQATELNTNIEGNLVPWSLIASEWNARLTPVIRDAGNDWVSTTGIDAASLGLEWKLADPNYIFNITAHLRGAWDNGSQSMLTTLNSVLPTGQPFNVSNINYAGTESVPAGFFTAHPNIVDWILVDFRKPSDGQPLSANSGTSIGIKPGFLLNNGTIVDLDGTTPMTVPISKQGAGFAVIRHRNHLAVMSNSLPSNAAGTYSNDFSVLANNYSKVGPTNAPAVLLPGSTKYGLWPGDANRDGGVNSSDISLVKVQVNNAASGYQPGDVNLDSTVNSGDIALTKFSVNNAAGTHSSRNGATKTLTSHVAQ